MKNSVQSLSLCLLHIWRSEITFLNFDISKRYNFIFYTYTINAFIMVFYFPLNQHFLLINLWHQFGSSNDNQHQKLTTENKKIAILFMSIGIINIL